MNQELKRLKRKLQTQQTQFDSMLKELKADYESQLLELQQTKQDEFSQLTLFLSFLGTNSESKLKVAYRRIKEGYLTLKNDFYKMKCQRDRYVDLYKQLQEEQEGEVKHMLMVVRKEMGIECRKRRI